MTGNITSEELFQRVEYIATAHDVTMSQRLRILHETLVLTCAAGLSDDGQPAGNLFSKVDLLCKRLRISTREAVAIQRMRHDSNRSGEQQPQADGLPAKEAVSREQLAYDCRSLAVFISAVFNEPIPGTLLRHIPVSLQPADDRRHIDARCLRCVVRGIEGDKALVETTAGEGRQLRVALDKQPYLAKLLHADMQVNLLDVQLNGDDATAMIIVEPDFLIDISSLARCFTDYGHSPLNYTVNRLSPVANSQAILLGNFAGSALDDIINQGEEYEWRETFKANFRERALEYCTCPDLNQRADFKQQAQTQVRHIEDAVDQLFSEYDRSHAILEPSFVCEQLGLQGRVDLMTTDLQLLVEQKSGSNWYIQTQRPGEHGGFQKEDHYVQVLLYYEVLRRNFQLGYNKIDGRLLYSKYPMPSGLVPATYYKELIRQALDLRNRIVGYEFRMAHKGFATLLPYLSVDRLNQRHISGTLWTDYLLPQLTGLLEPLHQLPPLEHDYFCRMMTFVYREQLAGRLGVEEGHGGAMADLWNMPLSEKLETGNIYTGLEIIKKEQSSCFNGYDLLTLSVTTQAVDFLPNFREGDSIYLYPYIEGQEPDVRHSILFKGQLVSIGTTRLIVHLSDGQQNPNIFEAAGLRNLAGHITVKWCIEHSSSDSSTAAAIRSLYQMITDVTGHRELLLCRRAPRRDASLTLSRSYSPTYDDVILRAKQARDMFLIIGPPGTGKTSMALQFLVREASAGVPATADSCTTAPAVNILLMAYTNRAVDEICEMLTDNAIDYLRIGNRYTCAEPYRDHLIDEVLEQYQSLREVKDRILKARIIVGTTSTIQNRTYLFALKHFQLAIIDEASQILEPQIVGLLTKADKFILIGDYKQLPAVVAQRPQESAVSEPSLQDIALTDCRNSLFQRLIENELRHGRTDFIGTLNRQGRMHPDVAAFSCKAFYRREEIRPVPLPHQLETSLSYDTPSLDATDDLLKQHRVLFFPSQFCREPGISDKVNADEARIVASLVLRIARFYGTRFDAQKTIGIIVPYRNQIAMIRQAIERLTGPDTCRHDGCPDGLRPSQTTAQQLKDIAIDTVERYQGSQRDVIIYSFTIQQRYQLDFLAANTIEEDGHLIDRKLNVALTRARRQLLLTGNTDILSHNPLFRELMEYVTKVK